MTQIPKNMINQKLISDIQSLKSKGFGQTNIGTDSSSNGKKDFSDYLKDEIKGLNETQKVADKAAADLATGKSESIHETMLKATNAELNFNLFVQLRNKALDAYQEVMRMQV